MKFEKTAIKLGTITLLVTGILFGSTVGGLQEEVYAKSAVVKKSTSVKAKGTFIGLADNQSFEVKFDQDTKIIRLLEKNKHLIKGLKKGDLITISYWVNVKGQNILGSTVKKETIKKGTKSTSVRASGTYMGMADQQSFEVKIGKNYKMIRITGDNKHKIKGLKKGDSITFTYWVNVKGQNILGTTLKKK
ncbi:tRNA (Thr-GGU) A37 N-methylase [Bacillus mesophilus]|uniref:DUF5666 domain-containing protein n=1 Tax=Bacillus mesophilus TaxID=1808955 RepID=A0A6M0Q6R5_9BACI|nr:hypothetical protein [Bacillus mesophilus]MBM7661373.1 tRNA (Thr-GGU) A37 N-methylase [Bacillus mesophilus]NEY72046.1 hypothetical protein [Bacillus mesophilus]